MFCLFSHSHNQSITPDMFSFAKHEIPSVRLLSRRSRGLTGFGSNLLSLKFETSMKNPSRQLQIVFSSENSGIERVLEKLTRQEELLESINARLTALESKLEKRSERNVEVAIDSSSRQNAVVEWSEEERLNKFRILAQLQADEVVESVRMFSKSALLDRIQLATDESKISQNEGEAIVNSSLVAAGMDLEEVLIVADCYDKPSVEEEYSLTFNSVESILVKAKQLRLVFGTNMVLPVLIGESIHPDALSYAISQSVHLIIRSQENNAVF